MNQTHSLIGFNFMNGWKLWMIGILFAVSACKDESVDRNNFPDRFEAATADHRSMSYDISYEMKFFSGTDTNRKAARVHLIREEEDTNFRGRIWIEEDSLIRYYNGANSFLIDEKEGVITQYPEGQHFIFSGNIIGDVVDIYFLKPERIRKGMSDSTNQIELGRNRAGNWVINYVFPDSDEFYNGSKVIEFSSKDFSLKEMTYRVSSQSETQYNHWSVSNARFDQLNSDSLKNWFDRYREKYLMKEYAPPKRDSLRKGEAFPMIEAYRYSDGELLKWSELNAELYLIDFWYMDCAPCIEAIPILNKLMKKYPSIGIIGLNPYDSTEKNLKRLPNFLEFNPIDYPFYFIDRKDVELAKVFAFPTLFLLNSELRVLDLKLGYGENSEEVLDSLIRQHLK